jgi:acyl-CoA synthetase (AMP-forming)/AMP-acid ligase II
MTPTDTDFAIGPMVASWRRYGNRPALVSHGRVVTYTELLDDAGRLGTGLQALGVQPGEAFAFLLPNGVDIISCYLACALSGIVGVPLAPRLTVDDLAHQIDDSGAVALLYADRWSDVANELNQRSPDVRVMVGEHEADSVRAPGHPTPQPQTTGDDPFCVMYTGGTTGTSKAAIQTQRAWAACLSDTVEQFGLNADDRHATVLPLTHAAWFSLGAHLHVGAVTHIVERWDPAAYLELVETEHLTVLHLIPTLLGDVLAAHESAPTDVSSARLLTLAGAPIPTEMFHRGRRVFGEIIGNIYGLTEAAGPVTYLLPQDLNEEKLRSGGRVGRYVELQIIDAADDPDGGPALGEIALRGPQLTPGYLNRPEETATAFRDGWFCTGDIGYVDDAGFLFIIDRKKEMVKSGGFNVYPQEVENVLYRNDEVVEAAVFGVPDPKWIEALVACVVLREGTTLDESGLIAYCRATLPGYKTPKVVQIVDALPRTGFGKFDKKALRQRFVTVSD